MGPSSPSPIFPSVCPHVCPRQPLFEPNLGLVPYDRNIRRFSFVPKHSLFAWLIIPLLVLLQAYGFISVFVFLFFAYQLNFYWTKCRFLFFIGSLRRFTGRKGIFTVLFAYLHMLKKGIMGTSYPSFLL